MALNFDGRFFFQTSIEKQFDNISCDVGVASANSASSISEHRIRRVAARAVFSAETGQWVRARVEIIGGSRSHVHKVGVFPLESLPPPLAHAL